MGEKEIKEECEHIKHDVEKMVGRETENILNNNPKAKEKANKH
jgi:hypothetical protein